MFGILPDPQPHIPPKSAAHTSSECDQTNAQVAYSYVFTRKLWVEVGILCFISVYTVCENRGSSVSIVTRLRTGLTGFDSRQKLFFSSSLRPDQHWAPPSPLSNWHPGLLSGRDVRLTPHLHLQLKLRLCGSIPPLLHTS
jgi:hypothetical protein